MIIMGERLSQNTSLHQCSVRHVLCVVIYYMHDYTFGLICKKWFKKHCFSRDLPSNRGETSGNPKKVLKKTIRQIDSTIVITRFR